MTKRNKVKKYAIMTAGTVGSVILLFLSVRYQYPDNSESGVPDAVSSFYNGRECRLTVTANSSDIDDREQFAREVFQMCRENLFRTIKLSTDISGWPESLDIAVYYHRTDIGEKAPVMRIRFVPPDDGERYDIWNDPGEYEMLIE